MQIIDLNDGELTCFNKQGEVVYREPSIVYLDGQDLVYGSQALSRVKSQPQACASQYMGRLSDEALPTPLGKAFNQADLIYYQLLDVRERLEAGDCAFLIPAYISDAQLQLLMGIAQAAQLNPKGFINSGLAYAPQPRHSDNFNVFDIGLRQGQLSRVSIEHKILSNNSIANQDGLGLFAITDLWLQEIAKVFLDSIRFDPLHSAATEQQAFDQVMGWISNATLPADARINVDIDGYSRIAEINISNLIRRLDIALKPLSLGPSTRLVLTPRAARVPELLTLLSHKVAEISVASEEEYFQRAHQIIEGFSAGEVERHNSCPANHSKVKSAESFAQEADTAYELALTKNATHLLTREAALPLTHSAFAEFLDDDGLIRPNAQVLINSQPAIQAKLKHGDQVSFAADQWSAIYVE
jgi:hypothetical protein